MRRLIRRRAGTVLASLALACTAACAGLIGVPDLYLDPNAEQGGGEAGNGSETSTTDGPVGVDGGEGGADVVTTCNADLQTDLKNCGACGHDCTNGVCNAGLCILAQDMPSPGAITVRGASVYVGQHGGTGAIISCPTNGCASATVGVKVLSIDAGDPYPWRVVANDTYVFASDYSGFNNGGVRRVLATGGDFRRLPVTPAMLERSYGIALDNTAVYWTTNASPGAVHWCDLPACAGGLQTAAASNDGELIAVAADGTLVWADNGGGIIKRCASKSACTPVDLVPDFQGVANALVIEGNTVYWGTNFGEILSCATSGCANATKIFIEAPQATVAALAVNGSTLYWSSMIYDATGNNVIDSEGVIKTCTLPKCTAADVKTIATKQKDPDGIALDAKSVYWVNSGKRGFTDGIGNLVKAPR
jgi:hypothetical protein